jgi:hypothetical protein
MGLFDDDPVVQACKRDTARQEADERKAEQSEHDQKIDAIFREALLTEYDAELLEICDRQLSKETLAAYSGEFQRFARWCQDFGISSLPASREAAAFYMSEQCTSYSAAKRAHAALSYHHQIRGLPDCCPGLDPNADADAFDASSRPFPAAVLRRFKRSAEQRSPNSEEA